jgi:hypothetical protein
MECSIVKLLAHLSCKTVLADGAPVYKMSFENIVLKRHLSDDFLRCMITATKVSNTHTSLYVSAFTVAMTDDDSMNMRTFTNCSIMLCNEDLINKTININILLLGSLCVGKPIIDDHLPLVNDKDYVNILEQSIYRSMFTKVALVKAPLTKKLDIDEYTVQAAITLTEMQTFKKRKIDE